MKREIEVFNEKLSNYQKEDLTKKEVDFIKRLKILFQQNIINEMEMNQKLKFIYEK